jgi:hypothetical protein
VPLALQVGAPATAEPRSQLGPPAEALQIDAAAGGEDDPLLEQEQPLQLLPAGRGARADPALGVDDAVPGHLGGLGQGVQRVAHLARVPGQPGELGDLAVGGDAALGDRADDAPDTLVGDRPGHGREYPRSWRRASQPFGRHLRHSG